MVADGQVLVLGGFIKTKMDEAINRTPLLSDIPILGWLFKNKKRTITKDYIFVFMCPSIVKPRQKPGSGIYTKMKLHDVANRIDSSIELKKQRDPIQNWFFGKNNVILFKIGFSVPVKKVRRTKLKIMLTRVFNQLPLT
jgi:hypothetical protein